MFKALQKLFAYSPKNVSEPPALAEIFLEEQDDQLEAPGAEVLNLAIHMPEVNGFPELAPFSQCC